MAIPKIIHYCWCGGATKPKSVQRCIESWKKYCPDYKIKEWNESNLNITINDYTQQAYEAKAWGFVPDFLRLWIIYNYGGIYLDTDVQIVRNFDSLLNESGFAGFEDNEHISFGLGFGAEARNHLIKKQMHVYDNLKFFNADGTLNRTPSPTYITSIMMAEGFHTDDGNIQRINGFACYPSEYFCPKNFATGITKVTKKTYSIHQFDASWYSKEEQLQRKQWEKAARRDYFVHTPNRIARKILGESTVKRLKELLGKE